MKRRTVVIFLLLGSGVFAESSNEWPTLFAVPERPDSVSDSIKARLSEDATIFKSSEKTSTSFEWFPSFSSWKLRQRWLVETSGDNAYRALNQFYDFSGVVTRDSALPYNGALGIEWRPTAYLNLRSSGSGFQTTSDIGPLMQWRLHTIPIRLRGGMSGVGWYDSLPEHLSQSRESDFHGNAGFYGAVRLGDPSVPIPAGPLYCNVEAYGRSIKQAGLGVVTGSARFFRDIGTGDSLFVFYGDSLSNGKENFWGGTAGVQRYMSTPWRIARSFQAAGGFKAKERFGFLPACVYSYARNSVTYPTFNGVLSDVRTGTHSLQFLLGTREDRRLIYKGGLKYCIGSEEWLFGSSVPTAVPSYLDSVRRQQLLDSLQVKLGDHRNYLALSDHYLGINLSSHLLAEYKLSLFRDSKYYTFSYTDRGVMVRKPIDNDLITVNHHGGIQLQKARGWDIEIWGEYSTYLVNNIDSTMSANNQTEHGYRTGINCSYQPLERLLLNERIVADAEMTDFMYKQAHRGDLFSPPPYQRRFSSICSGTLKIGRGWEIKGRWIAMYHDNGTWIGKEYLLPEDDTSRSNYYAIQYKTTESSLEVGLSRTRGPLYFEGGCLIKDIFNRQYSGEEAGYAAVNNGIGYTVEPYADARLQLSRLNLKCRIVRMVNTLDPNRWTFRNNWDIHVTGTAEW